MGQKVNPIGIRLGIIRDWSSKWYANSQNYANYLNTDLQVREYIKKTLAKASVSQISIERPAKNARIIIHTARPGIVIGKKGEDIEKLRNTVSAMMKVPVHINVEEIRKPEIDAYLVAEGVAQQLERRIMFRRAMKRAVSNALRMGAKGIRINVAGRLNGAEIARTEWYREGRVPLHTLRADVDYGIARANTTYGVIGVKVWIFKGEIIGKQMLQTTSNSDKQAPGKKPARPAKSNRRNQKR
jgi:small subunit ribosomal protein S3